MKYAKNRDNAVRLLEFLAGDFAQKMYAAENHEYPVKPGVPWSDLVKSWGRFKADRLPLRDVARFRPRAARLIDRVDLER